MERIRWKIPVYLQPDSPNVNIFSHLHYQSPYVCICVWGCIYVCICKHTHTSFFFPRKNESGRCEGSYTLEQQGHSLPWSILALLFWLTVCCPDSLLSVCIKKSEPSFQIQTGLVVPRPESTQNFLAAHHRAWPAFLTCPGPSLVHLSAHNAHFSLNKHSLFQLPKFPKPGKPFPPLFHAQLLKYTPDFKDLEEAFFL